MYFQFWNLSKQITFTKSIFNLPRNLQIHSPRFEISNNISLFCTYFKYTKKTHKSDRSLRILFFHFFKVSFVNLSIHPRVALKRLEKAQYVPTLIFFFAFNCTIFFFYKSYIKVYSCTLKKNLIANLNLQMHVDYNIFQYVEKIVFIVVYNNNFILLDNQHHHCNNKLSDIEFNTCECILYM